MPEAFFKNRLLPSQSDLVIILGTSLTVQPFANLPQMVRTETPRLLINLERVGNMGACPDDVLLLGDCDEGVRKLAKACGWLDELEELWAATGAKYGDQPEQDGAAPAREKSKDERLQDEVEKLTREVEETLRLSKDHESKVHGETLADVTGGVAKSIAEDPVSTATAPLTKAASTPDNPNISRDKDSSKVDGEGPEGGGLSHIIPHSSEKSTL